MAENTKIEWTHHTFNPWEGCQKVGPGCDHCYAQAHNARFAGGTAINWGPGAPRRRTSAANWRQPIRWNAKAERLGIRYRVFCASLADVFDNQVPAQWRTDLFRLIAETPNLDWLLLTKRIGNAPAMLNEAVSALTKGFSGWISGGGHMRFKNVWLGITVCNQDEAERDIAKLLDVPACVRFLSIEPMLGHITLPGFDFKTAWRPNMLHWVIAGGESGPCARPMQPDWARSLRDQCVAAKVPFFFKQWGGVGKAKAGRLLDGLLHDAYPQAPYEP